MSESEVKTFRSAVATITFSGGADTDSDSESTQESCGEDYHESAEKGTDTETIANNANNSNTANNNIPSDSSSDQENLPKESLDKSLLQQDSITIIDPTTENEGSSSVSQSMTFSDKHVVKNDRFNPFDKEEYDPNEKLFPHAHSTEASPTGDAYGSISSGSWPDSPELSRKIDQEINAELGISEDHFGAPEGHFGASTIEELELAINNCKMLILSAQEHTERRRNLVTKLVQLRLQLAEVKEGPQEQDPTLKQVVGHHFEEKENRRTKHYCEKCNNVIWGVLHTWYRCRDCGFSCHSKCLNLITRTCASVKVSENPVYIMSIAPEKGLSQQNYKCAECKTPISYQSGFEEPRQCDYTGSYYCPNCHWNDTMIIPARVLHNWDFEQRKVCRASKQFLKMMLRKAVIRIQDINPMLFNFVEELSDVKKLREEILVMKKYFLTCKAALGSKLLLQLSERQHFVEASDQYSLQDLIDVATDVLLPEMAKIHASFAQHIKTDCQRCQGQGYICELCDYEEVLFPFDNHAIVCAQCSTVLHRHCYMRRNQKCPKCERISKRSKDIPTSSGL